MTASRSIAVSPAKLTQVCAGPEAVEAPMGSSYYRISLGADIACADRPYTIRLLHLAATSVPLKQIPARPSIDPPLGADSRTVYYG